MKTFSRSVGLISLCLIAGCSRSDAPTENPSSASTGKITIRGSNTVGEELAPALIVAYKKDHPSARFDLEAKGTSYGFGALMGGFCDIAGASRSPSKDELEVAQFRGVEWNDHVIGAYCVAIIVNGANSVTNLTKEQVRDIFTGALTNWNQVGWHDAPVHLFIRDPISGTYLGFKELAMENKAYAETPNLFTNYANIVKAVGADVDGIGYSSIELADGTDAKSISIGGVMPGKESVNKGEYPYTRMLHLYTNKGHETPETLDFLQFIQSPKGQEILAQVGDVPLP